MKFVFAHLLLLAGLGLTTSPAFAATENEQAAQAAFDEALKLMKEKKYSEACAHLARSQDLDPAMGTQFRLAECYEKLGRQASAYDLYIDVANDAKATKQAQRESVAKTRAAALESKIARLTIDISESVSSLSGVEIRRDGVLVPKKQWGQPMTIDLGDHVVTVRAPRKQPFEKKFWADASAKMVVSVAALDGPKDDGTKPRSRIPLYVMGGVGLAGIGAGITFVALRSSQITDARAQSKQIIAGDGNCRGNGSAGFEVACASLLQMAQRGDTFGTLSIVGFSVGGAALLGAAGYFFWPESRPRDEAKVWRIVPMMDSQSVGLTAMGAF
jgi:tetratricopeptide (TPR) repeat protein